MSGVPGAAPLVEVEDLLVLRGGRTVLEVQHFDLAEERRWQLLARMAPARARFCCC